MEHLLDRKPGQLLGDRITLSSPALDPLTMKHAINGLANGGKAILGVRPQYLTPGTQGPMHGTVTLAERLGTETVVDVELTRGGRVIVALGQEASFAPGAGLLLGLPAERAHLLRVTSPDHFPLVQIGQAALLAACRTMSQRYCRTPIAGTFPPTSRLPHVRFGNRVRTYSVQ